MYVCIFIKLHNTCVCVCVYVCVYMCLEGREGLIIKLHITAQFGLVLIFL